MQTCFRPDFRFRANAAALTRNSDSVPFGLRFTGTADTIDCRNLKFFFFCLLFFFLSNAFNLPTERSKPRGEVGRIRLSSENKKPFSIITALQLPCRRSLCKTDGNTNGRLFLNQPTVGSGVPATSISNTTRSPSATVFGKSLRHMTGGNTFSGTNATVS